MKNRLAPCVLLLLSPLWAQQELRVAYFGQDPPAIEPLSSSFDPDSYAVITQIFDSLVWCDLEGQLQPGLATRWRRLDALTWEFTLRQGVAFHNGEPFDASDVAFTYRYALDPANHCGNAWILGSIAEIITPAGDPYRVLLRTHRPDGMFLYRFSMFGSICPADTFARMGREAWSRNPVGTGPFVLDRWQRGSHIRLVRNPHYWNPDLPKLAAVSFRIIPADHWVDALLAGEVDFLPNLAGNQTELLKSRDEGRAKIMKRLVLSGYWVMLRNRGPLALLEVRQALNLAVNREDLVAFGDQNNAIPLASLGKTHERGAHPHLQPYPYRPDQARILLQKAGFASLALKGIASDVAAPIAQILRRQWLDCGVTLNLEIVPRSEWAERVIGSKIRSGQPADYDLAINLVDNPIHHLGFHAGLFLDSRSPWSLLQDGEFDRRYHEAMEQPDEELHWQQMRELDRYIHEQALMVFTTQRIVTAAHDQGLELPHFGLNGHLDYLILSSARFKEP